jgi:hypothetical protein
MSQFEKYPMLMVHPNFRPAQSIMIEGTERRNARGDIVSAAYRGTPEINPPVTAVNEDREEYFAAQGYVPAGKGDPAAWVQAHSSAPADTYKPQKYPMMKVIDGVERTINSAEEDPDAMAEDFEPDEAPPEPIPAPPQPNEADNLRLQLEAMQRQMEAMTWELAEARQKAPDQQPAAEPRPRGRPRKIREDRAA